MMATRQDDGSIILTAEEARDVAEFIDNTLDREWDQYTSRVITRTPWEQGKREMNKHMYDFGATLELLLASDLNDMVPVDI